jgi:hypothetical protein
MRWCVGGKAPAGSLQNKNLQVCKQVLLPNRTSKADAGRIIGRPMTIAMDEAIRVVWDGVELGVATTNDG